MSDDQRVFVSYTRTYPDGSTYHVTNHRTQAKKAQGIIDGAKAAGAPLGITISNIKITSATGSGKK